MLTLAFRGRRAFVLASALAASLLLAPLSSLSAHAALTYCRTDPVVLLSNGKSVQMEADIADTASDVQHIDYVLRAPAGTTVVSIIYSGDLPANQESFEFISDGAPGNYDTGTTVTTDNPDIDITASTTITGGVVDTQEGRSGHSLHCHLKSL
jgi:hypothetical protein